MATSQLLAALGLAACRIGPLICAMPFVGIGGRLLLLGGGVALVGPLLLPGIIATSTSDAALWPLYAHELCVGLLLLFGASLPWLLLRIAGRLLDALRAESLPDAMMERLCGLLALCLFLGGGGAALATRALSRSYSLLPLPTLPGPLFMHLSPRPLVGLLLEVCTLALKLALPLVGAWLMAMLGIGLVARFAWRSAQGPLGARLAMTLSAPLPAVRTIVELLVMVASFVALVASWQEQLRTLPMLAF